MKLENEILNIIVTRLKNLFDAEDDTIKVISYKDYNDDRIENMVIVGIENSSVVEGHEGLNDYQHDLSITIDSFIADDLHAEKFFKIAETVEEYLNFFTERVVDVKNLFGELPVVGFLYKNSQYTITNDSNRVTIFYTIFSSR